MSQQTYLQSLTDRERKDYLESNAQNIDEGKYTKPLTEYELADAKSSLSDNCIKLSDYREDFEEVKKEYKTKKNPYESHNKILLGEIRSKQRIAVGMVYHLPNFSDGFMESYNETGEFLGSRKLRPDEKQGQVFAIAQ